MKSARFKNTVIILSNSDLIRKFFYFDELSIKYMSGINNKM